MKHIPFDMIVFEPVLETGTRRMSEYSLTVGV
jgi:hypothetical protein